MAPSVGADRDCFNIISLHLPRPRSETTARPQDSVLVHKRIGLTTLCMSGIPSTVHAPREFLRRLAYFTAPKVGCFAGGFRIRNSSNTAFRKRRSLQQ